MNEILTDRIPTLNPSQVVIKPVYIGTEKELNDYLPFLQSSLILAIDVEYPAMRRFRDKISLIQIGTAEQQFLIDTEKLYPKALKQIFENPKIEKVFFDCEQDIVMIKNLLHCEIKSVVDASHLYRITYNLNTKFGLDKVVNTFYGPIIDHEEKHKFQKIDWRIRPIAFDAQNYAASDVAYLIPICDYLNELLLKKGYSDNLSRLSKSYELIKPPQIAITDYLFQLRYSYGFTDPIDKLLSVRIHKLRTKLAKQSNKPFFFILGKTQFYNIINQKPKTEIALKRILSKNQRKNTYLIESLLSIINSTSHEFEENRYLLFYEYEFHKEIYSSINKKFIDQFSLKEFLEIAFGNFDLMNDINRTFQILMQWRKIKARSLDIHQELLLSTYAIKKISIKTAYSFDSISLLNVEGLSESLWSEYGDEILFWINSRYVNLKEK